MTNARAGDGDARSGSLARTELALERTFAAWVRTAIAVMLVGLAIVRFLATEGAVGKHAVIALGGLYVVTGVGLLGFAAWDYQRSERGIVTHHYHAPRRWILGIALALALLSLALVGVLGWASLRR